MGPGIVKSGTGGCLTWGLWGRLREVGGMGRSHAGELSTVHACYPRTQDSEVRGSRFKTRDGKETPVGKVRRLKIEKISVPLQGPKVEREN